MERYQEIERSIMTTYRKKIWNQFTKGIREFDMIQSGDKIAVCISGGKDSMLLAKCMQELQRHGKIDFELVFLVMNPGYNEINKQNLINVEEKKYEIEDFKFEVIYTPGHRNDLVTYYFYEENIMFTGDFLFKGVIGRTDLEYSSFNDMKKSLIKIYKYSDDIIIYPGHGESSNMKNEKNNNYYLGGYNEK